VSTPASDLNALDLITKFLQRVRAPDAADDPEVFDLKAAAFEAMADADPQRADEHRATAAKARDDAARRRRERETGAPPDHPRWVLSNALELCACGHRRGLHTGAGATRTSRGTVLDDGACVGPIGVDGNGEGCSCAGFRRAAPSASSR